MPEPQPVIKMVGVCDAMVCMLTAGVGGPQMLGGMKRY